MSEDIFEELKPIGLIEDLKTTILESIPTSPKWAEAIAITLQSTVTSKMKISTDIGPLDLNLWNLMIGPSGLAYKSTPLRYYVYPILIEVSRLIGKPVIMPGEFSEEGMIEYLSEKHSKGRKAGEPKHNEGIIIRDEFTSLLKGYQQKSYLADIMELLSELYDGAMKKRYTRKKKLEHTVDVYVSLLAATTPYLFSLMERHFFVQGTGNRILYTMYEPTEVRNYDVGEFFVDGARQREKSGKITEFAEVLAGLWKSNVRYIYPMPDIEKVWLRFRKQKLEEALQRYKKDPQDLVYSYLQRIPTMSLKIAGHSAISRGAYTLAQDPDCAGDTLMIDKEDFQYAIIKADEHYNDFLLMLDKWGQTPLYKPARSDEPNLTYMLGFIRRSPDGLLTQTELLRYSGWTTDKRFYEAISTLTIRGDIVPLEKEEVIRLRTETQFSDLAKKHGLYPPKRGQVPNVYILNKPGFLKLYKIKES